VCVCNNGSWTNFASPSEYNNNVDNVHMVDNVS